MDSHFWLFPISCKRYLRGWKDSLAVENSLLNHEDWSLNLSPHVGWLTNAFTYRFKDSNTLLQPLQTLGHTHKNKQILSWTWWCTPLFCLFFICICLHILHYVPAVPEGGQKRASANPLELVLNPLSQCWELCPGPGRAVLLTSGPSLKLWFETGLAMEPWMAWWLLCNSRLAQTCCSTFDSVSDCWGYTVLYHA